jgi:hypothetical protein
MKSKTVSVLKISIGLIFIIALAFSQYLQYKKVTILESKVTSLEDKIHRLEDQISNPKIKLMPVNH